MDERLTRQSFLGINSDEVLGSAHVAIIGVGGGGSHVAQQLAHVGIGHIMIIDPDVVDTTNLNRLVGATTTDARRRTPKVVVAKRRISDVNPRAHVTMIKDQWQDHATSLRACDAIIGCVDSYSERAQLEITARRYHVPYLDLGMDVHDIEDQYCISGQVILSMPGDLCLRCLGFLTDDLLAREAANYGAAGARPQVIWPNGILASTAVALLIQLITPWHDITSTTTYLEYDGNAHTIGMSNRLKAVRGQQCRHFGIDELGDPFWKLTAAKKTSAWARLRALFRRG